MSPDPQTEPRPTTQQWCPDSPERVARIFISSTFDDLQTEREAIARQVIPELQVRARSIDLEVVCVDLRWGIPPAEARRGGTVRSCLAEVSRCNFFVGLIGTRYGWIPDRSQFTDAVIAEFPVLRDSPPQLSITHLEFLQWIASKTDRLAQTFLLQRSPPSDRDDVAMKPHRLLRELAERNLEAQPFRDSSELARSLTARLWDSIAREFPRRTARSAFDERSSRHAAYASRLIRDFVGRESTVHEIAASIRSRQVTVVTGAVGSGRTSALSKAVDAYRATNPSDAVLVRFADREGGQLGPSMFAGDIYEAIVREPARPGSYWMDAREAREMVNAAFRITAARQRSPQIFVAALDLNLRSVTVEDLDWLPRPAPDWFRLVLTAEASASPEVTGCGTIAIPDLAPAEATAMLSSALAREGRKLTDRQLVRAVGHPEARKPLFLRTVIHEISKAPSFRAMPRRLHRCLEAPTTHDLVCRTLASAEHRFGRQNIRRTLAAALTSHAGMTEQEICDFAKIPMARWANIRNQLQGWLYYDEGVVQIRSLQFCGAIGARHFETPEDFFELCRELGEWWLTRRPERRVARMLHALLPAIRDPTLRLRILTDRGHGPWMLESVPVDWLAESWEQACTPFSNKNPSIFAAEVLEGAMTAWSVVQQDGRSAHLAHQALTAERGARLRLRLLEAAEEKELPGWP